MHSIPIRFKRSIDSRHMSVMTPKKMSTVDVVTVFLFCLWVCNSPAEAEQVYPLRAGDARLAGGTRLFENPERLGLPQIGSSAKWRIRLRQGTYDVDLTYSAGDAEEGEELGEIRVKIGSKRYEKTIHATGRWGRSNILTIPAVHVSSGTRTISVSVVKRRDGVGTVMDLWRIELEQPNPRIKDAGRVRRMSTEHGRYVQYIPRSAETTPRFLVLIHGTPGRTETALACAEHFLSHFISEAKHRGVVLLAPAFDTKNFGGFEGPGGGYRGLFGRNVAADVFVNEILQAYQQRFQRWDGKIYLYGHSAGGQFVSRYLVMHPDRIIASVVSAAGTYAFPNAAIKWADGMAPLRRQMLWDGEDATREVNVVPDPERWVEASLLSTTVIVGRLDDSKLRESPAQPGRNMIERAKQWTRAMNDLAAANGKKGAVQLILLDGVGHNGRLLSVTGIKHLFQKTD